jgi:hypothetical protein
MKSRKIVILLSLASCFGLFNSAAFAQKIKDLPDAPPGSKAAHTVPDPNKDPFVARSGNSEMTLIEYSDGVRQKIVNGNTLTKFKDGTVCVQHADGSEEWKYDSPFVVGRAGTEDGTRVTLWQNGTQYISTPDPATGDRTGQLTMPNGATIDITAPAPGYGSNNNSNPYLPAGTSGSDNPYLNAANANAPPPVANNSPGVDNSALINALLTPVSPQTYGSPLPPYVAGPLIDSLGTTLSSPGYSPPATVPMTPVTPSTTNQACPGM